MELWWDLLMGACAVGCGVVAGVFFVFSTFVMQGLGRMAASEGMRAMQAISITAVRPALMGLMFGTAGLCVAAAVWSLMRWGQGGAVWAIGGAGLYLVGVIGMTIAFHVPRNDRLAGLGSDSQAGWTTGRRTSGSGWPATTSARSRRFWR